ncbi:NAD(P)-dependent alcohol dehydrogenase [Sphingomonas sp. AR_OL41]|uniref:NAD(P)-dependent alcohol dehydrogenase n=1 Tax=Sphingomonas sp. AR_OL41 TaxID=3042729 RepID=UPI002480A708|nr:NAD(P)-dependent alcohol dehydrogenase [Sphingomonas sp. AR_OL41]MDH7974574.1 NAD(P)-dependent alcohol dehydrogenase [Sphingomonas sp. AR_OL41]
MNYPAQAAVLRGQSVPMSIEPVIIAKPRFDEVLVKIAGVGVCHTDMVMRDGLLPIPRPVVLGHEGAGRVLAVGSAIDDLAPGDHVALSFSSCGQCPSCDLREPAYCHSWVPLNFFGARADGSTAITAAGGEPVHSHVFGQSSFATHAVVHRRNAVKVDRDLPIELLGPLGCGIMTGAGAVLNALKVRPGSSIAVIGVGAVGLAAVMAARIAGASAIVAIDRHPSRIALARELGATHAVAADGRDIAEIIASLGIAGLDYALDTTGVVPLVEQTISALAPRGEMALVAAFAPGAKVGLDATHVMSGGRVIRGVVEGSADPQTFIPQLLAYHRAGKLPFDRLIKTYPFEDILTAIADGEEGRVVKPVLLMPD